MNAEEQKFNQVLLDFISSSPTPFHAVASIIERLSHQGYEQLQETENWSLRPNQGYWVTRNGSSIIAFHTGESLTLDKGIRMVGAHTDSPCLKIKPDPELKGHGCQRLAAEVYGGVLLAPWFDRDLSLAGRVTYKTPDGEILSTLIDFEDPIAQVPSLAIHLDRKANDDRKIQRQKDLNLVLATNDEKLSFKNLLEERLAKMNVESTEVLDHEIYTYDTQPPAITGLNKDFIVSARLDNLLSCFVGLEALLASDNSQPKLLVCNDHEEVGSQSASGAQGPFLRDVIERLCEDNDHKKRVLAASLMISADNAHGIHPNFPEKHDASHGPKLNAGPVIKVNANQRYATNSETSALFKHFAQEASVPVQTFVARNDMGCGSTIGPITSAEVGVATIDVGCPQWGMHSIRETAGAKDAKALKEVLRCFYQYPKLLRIG